MRNDAVSAIEESLRSPARTKLESQYRKLVDKKYLQGLTVTEATELAAIKKELNALDAEFYAAIERSRSSLK